MVAQERRDVAIGVTALYDPIALEQAQARERGGAIVAGDAFVLIEIAGFQHPLELFQQGITISLRQTAWVFGEKEFERSIAGFQDNHAIAHG